jgi:hypothetical protein
MRRILAILLVSSLCGCSSTHRHSVHGVLVTRNATDVEHCKHIGAVQTVPPYALPGDDMEQISSRTIAIGADTVLLDASRRAVATTGIAYRCRAT